MGIFDIKWTHEKFIDEATKKHEGKGYIYPEQYNGTKTKILMICPKHGSFQQTPFWHLRTCGCPKCGLENKNTNLKTKEQFVKEANSIFIGRGYEYPDDYEGNKIKIRIICPKHGAFRMKPNCHLAGKQGCPKCGRENITGNTEWFIKKSKEHPVHRDKNYDYSKTRYKTCRQKVIIICPIHKEFLQTPIEHMRGNGCPKCQTSKGEVVVRDFLDSYKIVYIPQHRFSDCRGKMFPLPFDFYIPDKNLLIEYQGKQHYKRFYWETDDIRLKERQRLDDIKRQYCLTNNITLIEICYDDDAIKRLTKVFSSLPSRQ